MASKITNIKKLIKRCISPVDLKSLNQETPVDEHMGFSRGKPIDRFYIEKHLKKNRNSIKGHLLEVAEDHYIKEFCSSPNTSSFAVLDFNKEEATPPLIYNFDLEQTSTCPENEFDCFVCTNTFNFIYDIKAAIKSSHKILKPGGSLVGTVASYTQVSKFDYERWGDFWRFTDKSIKRLLQEEFGNNVDVEIYGNFSTALALMQGLALEDIKDKSILDSTDPIYASVIGFKAVKK